MSDINDDDYISTPRRDDDYGQFFDRPVNVEYHDRAWFCEHYGPAASEHDAAHDAWLHDNPAVEHVYHVVDPDFWEHVYEPADGPGIEARIISYSNLTYGRTPAHGRVTLARPRWPRLARFWRGVIAAFPPTPPR